LRFFQPPPLKHLTGSVPIIARTPRRAAALGPSSGDHQPEHAHTHSSPVPLSRACCRPVGCGGSEQSVNSQSSTSTTTSTISGGQPAKVFANDASAEELTAAFEAQGIPNAERWAEEVEEYRRYPAEEPNFTKLREEVAKYDTPAGVVDKIVATLEP
jgi:hypothetical protein